MTSSVLLHRLPLIAKTTPVRSYFEPQSDGSGLGLAICSQIVTKFDGSMRIVTSKAGGAEFVVRLPVQSAKATAPERAV